MHRSIISPGQITPIPNQARSYEINVIRPGVQLFESGGCGGEPSNIWGGDSPSLTDWNNKAGSIVITNKVATPPITTDPDNNYYGVILHSEDNYVGKCEHYAHLPPEGNDFVDIPAGQWGVCWGYCKCVNLYLPNKHSSISIYKWNQFLSNDEEAGVYFYSDASYGGGEIRIWDDEIDPFFPSVGGVALDLDDDRFNFERQGAWEGVLVSAEHKTRCQTFQDCPGSIRITGSYWVIFYDGEYCQVFKNTGTMNFKSEYIKTGGRWPKSVVIIPTR